MNEEMTEFKIRFFDEIDDPHQVTLLFQLSLLFPAMPRVLNELRANDDRYTPEFGIFAIAKNGDVAAGHLLMKIPTETTDGRLEIGGVNAVGTRPDSSRRGAMTAVMNASHQYFREHGLEHSFLTTSSRLVAMAFYEHLGYVELAKLHIAVKYSHQFGPSEQPEIAVRQFSEGDISQIAQIFRHSVAGSYGFTHRPDNFFKARNHVVGLELKPEAKVRIAQRDNGVSGYAYWESTPSASEAYEIMALDRASFHSLLRDAERRNPGAEMVVWCDGLSSREITWIQEAGYAGPIETYGRALIRSTAGKTDSREVRTMYGVASGNFRLGLLDQT